MKLAAAIAILILCESSASAHRLDEYLQGTLVSVSKTELQAEMTLTPGVAVLPALMASLDPDANGVMSDSEQQAYAAKVLADLSLTVDGQTLMPQLRSIRFPTIEEMKDGSGQIHIDYRAALPPGGRDRKITLQNHHQSAISVYQVNSLIPRDPDVQIAKQTRNESQSIYQLEYAQAGVTTLSSITRPWLVAIAIFIVARWGIEARARLIP